MWPRFNSDDLRIIGHYIGTLVVLMAIVMAVPLITALFMRQFDVACDFAIGVGASLVAGNLLRLLHPRPMRLNRRQALMVVALSWIVLALFAAVPLYLSGGYTSPADAVFDGLSALTTTGVRVSGDYDHVPLPCQLWRVLLVLMGGQGVVLIALSLGFFGRTGGLSLLNRDTGSHDDQVLPDVLGMTRLILIISGAMVAAGTVLGMVICLGIGIPFGKAVYYGFTLAVSAYDTGGVTPHSSSLIYFHSWEIELFCMMFMLFGAINFIVYTGLRRSKGELLHNTEIKTLAVWLTLSVIVVTFVMYNDNVFTTFPELLRRGTFMIISACTTAGQQTVYPQQMGLSFSGDVMAILMMVMVVGGSSGSAAGGIKAIRLGLIGKWIWGSIKHVLQPAHAVTTQRYHHYTDVRLTSPIATAAMVLFLLYAFTAIAGGMIGIAYGYDAIPAVFQSVAFVSTSGMSTGIVVGQMPAGLKFVYAVQMYLGRLEFIALIAAIVEIVISIVPHRKRVRS